MRAAGGSTKPDSTAPSACLSTRTRRRLRIVDVPFRGPDAGEPVVVLDLQARDQRRDAFRPLGGVGRVVALAERYEVAAIVLADRARRPHRLDVERLGAVLVAVRGMAGVHRPADAELEPGAAVLVAADGGQEPGGLFAQVVVDGDLADHRPFARGNQRCGGRRGKSAAQERTGEKGDDERVLHARIISKIAFPCVR